MGPVGMDRQLIPSDVLLGDGVGQQPLGQLRPLGPCPLLPPARSAYRRGGRLAERHGAARHQQQQQYQAHQEANPDLADRRRELLRVQAWRKRADARAVELLRPEWSRDLGERPATVKGGRAWDRAVEQTIEYRQRWNVEDAEHPVGREPHGPDASLAQRQAWRHATRAVGRLRELADDRTDRAERGDHREATGRSGQEGDHVKATSRGDHRGGQPSDHEAATGRGDSRGDRWSDRRRPLDRDHERDHAPCSRWSHDHQRDRCDHTSDWNTADHRHACP